MPDIVSLPFDPPPVLVARAPASALVCVKLFGNADGTNQRQAYREALGAEPPPYDATRPTQRWFVTNGQTKFGYYDGTRAWSEFDNPHAGAPNLWGPTQRPTYSVPPTLARHSGPPASPASFPYQSTELSTEAEAHALATMWGLPPASVINGAQGGPNGGGVFGDYFPPDEARRPWFLVVGQSWYNVGQQLAMANDAGVGSRGHWAGPGQWVGDEPALPAKPNPEGPIPERQLKAHESFVVNGLVGDGAIYVQNTDLQPLPTGAPAAGVTDAHYQDLVHLITVLQGDVSAIKAWFHIQ